MALKHGSKPALARSHAAKVQSAVAKPVPADVKRVLSAALVTGGAIMGAAPALAVDDAVDAATNSAIEAVKATGAAARTAFDFLSAGAKVVQQGIDVAAPVVKQGVDAVAPVVKSAVKATADTAVPAFKAAAPVVSDTLGGALKATGLDLNTAGSTASGLAKTAASSAVPALSSLAVFVTSKDPVTLAEYGLGAGALYLLGPTLLGGLAGGFRGFAGELTATQTLDAVNNDGNSVLVDLRSAQEKERGGLPDVAGSARDRVLEVEFATTEDRRLRGQLRDANAVEAQVTALQVSSLKRVGRGTRIVLLDRNGGQAKTIAKELARRGFGKVFVVAGGFEGRGGWVQSKLLVKPAAGGGRASAPSPLQSLARTVSTRTLNSSNSTSRKSLPAPSK